MVAVEIMMSPRKKKKKAVPGEDMEKKEKNSQSNREKFPE